MTSLTASHRRLLGKAVLSLLAPLSLLLSESNVSGGGDGAAWGNAARHVPASSPTNNPT